ncbi:MAG TPA: putative lipid II flippase FtsW [Gammaproteobacteria bacterium]|nr:putative lipid II flippase FtsW [Gammaproteobacteria bacterium]
MKLRAKRAIHYDPWMLISSLSLLGLGLLMVASSSIVISDRAFNYPFYYLIRQTIYLMLGLSLAVLITRIPMAFWQKISGYLILFSFFLLLLVLMPGIGREVNGSMRWIIIGPLSLQVSEFVKLGTITFIAGYLVRRQDEVQTRVRGFIKPLLILAGIALLLLQEPDFGATVVITATVFGMLFIAGARLWQFIFLLVMAICALGVLAISVPYRLLRLTTFLHPWSNPFDTGYQLTQSLIAFGRGGVFGVGLGNSVQKLFYLPEAHTDFLFAVIGEELGLVGQLAVVMLFTIFVVRSLLVSYRAYRNGHLFSAYLGAGLSLCMGLQAMINIGVNLGLLPTKGLTLPLMSYGGTSLLVNCLVLGILFRLAYESPYKNTDMPSIERARSVRAVPTRT